MPLVPGIHGLATNKDVHGGDKPCHDDGSDAVTSGKHGMVFMTDLRHQFFAEDLHLLEQAVDAVRAAKGSTRARMLTV